MEETNQNSQTSLDFNAEKFEPKDEIEIQQIIKYCYKKNLPIEIVGNKTKQEIGKNFSVQKLLTCLNTQVLLNISLRSFISK